MSLDSSDPRPVLSSLVRYGFGVQALIKNVPLPFIQQWMGHANLETTTTYLQVIGNEEKSVADRKWEDITLQILPLSTTMKVTGSNSEIRHFSHFIYLLCCRHSQANSEVAGQTAAAGLRRTQGFEPASTTRALKEIMGAMMHHANQATNSIGGATTVSRCRSNNPTSQALICWARNLE